jgi:uncharacterized protein (TIGR02271 family)
LRNDVGSFPAARKEKDFNSMGKNEHSAFAAPSTGNRDDILATIPLVEERFQVTKREIESGRVLVRVSVDERQETLSEQVSRDDVQVEHVAKNERVTEVPHVRLEGDTTIVPVVEEVLVVEKALVLVEEIHIRRRSVSETVQIPVTIRSERATVERTPAPSGAAAAAIPE